MYNFVSALFNAILTLIKHIPDAFFKNKVFWFAVFGLVMIFCIVSGVFVYFYV